MKSLFTAGGKLLFKSVAEATAKEAAGNIAKNTAMKAGEEGLVHLTHSAAAQAINESGKLGGAWGIFALEAGKVPASPLGRRAATFIPGNFSCEITIGAEAAQAFARPPPFGLFSAYRNLAGVRSSPLGSVALGGGFIPGEVLKGGAFRMATRGEHALQVGHQWTLDYGVDGTLYILAKVGLWLNDTGDALPALLGDSQ